MKIVILITSVIYNVEPNVAIKEQPNMSNKELYLVVVMAKV